MRYMRVSPLIPSIYNSLVAQKYFRSPPMISIQDGLTYDRVNSSALQATAARDAHGQVIVNDAKSVINDKTNLSERLPVINDTSAKMTCVVVFSINAYNLYGR